MKYIFQECPLKPIQRQLDLEPNPTYFMNTTTHQITVKEFRDNLFKVMDQATDEPSVTAKTMSKNDVWHTLLRQISTAPYHKGIPNDSDIVEASAVIVFNKEFEL